jgi:protoporphyrinogen oxidase
MPASWEEGRVERVETVVVGAGLAGMSAAIALGGETVVLEEEARPGGLVVTNWEQGFGFDVTGHWLHMRDPAVRERFGRAVPMSQVQRRSRILSHGRLVAYPFQSNLKDLPPRPRIDCLCGAIEAHRRRLAGAPEPKPFGDYVRHHFGDGIAREFMFPYNTKLWGVPPNGISHLWCQRFVPVPNLAQILSGGFTEANERGGYNAAFSYPEQGGIGSWSLAIARQVPHLRCSTAVRSIHPEERWVETADGARIGFTNLISTAPLDRLLSLLVAAPEEVLAAGRRLRCTALDYYDLGVDRPALGGLHWLYLPDRRLPMYRIGSYSNAVPGLAPPGCSSLYVETSCGRRTDPDSVLDRVLEILSGLGGPAVGRENVVVWRKRRIEHAYVVYDHFYQGATDSIRAYLEAVRLHSIGRYGRWVYSAMEDALIDGMQAAVACRLHRRP